MKKQFLHNSLSTVIRLLDQGLGLPLVLEKHFTSFNDVFSDWMGAGKTRYSNNLAKQLSFKSIDNWINMEGSLYFVADLVLSSILVKLNLKSLCLLVLSGMLTKSMGVTKLK